MDWISSVQFAALAEISQRRARKLCLEIENGDRLHWEGHALQVRTINGRGGKSGVSYLVRVSTLPPHLQERLKALQTPLETRSNGAPSEPKIRQHLWWVNFLRDAVAHLKGSPERAAALAALAGQPTTDWEGRPYTPQLRTLQRQARRHDENQTAAHKPRADKGSKRTFVSLKWDKAVPFDDVTKERIAAELTREIRGLVKSGAARGHVTTLASRHLRTLTRAEGFRVHDLPFLDRICAVPRHLVAAEWHYRLVHQFKRDRKAYEDSKPRIRRSIAGMRPMELVVADVHPVDVHVLRDDGSVATCRFVAFMDWATQRVRGRLVLLEKGGGIRNVDVIEAFADMAGDPAWGMPETFYVDNGSEYNFVDLLGDAMQLVVPGFHGPSRSCRIVRALPYNASAKPIERLFGDLEQRYLSSLPGWIGGDRMKKKQEAIGKTVAPFGTFDAFAPIFYGLVNSYHAWQQGKKGALKGRSPNEAFDGHVKAGWQAVTMARDEIRSACGKTVDRTVKGGCIEVAGRSWTCQELQAWPHDTVLVRIPAYHNPVELLLVDGQGRPIGVASEDRTYHPLDIEGAKEASARSVRRRNAVHALDRGAPDISVAQRLIAFGAETPPVTPNAPAGSISHGATSSPADRRRKAEADRKAKRKEADELLTMREKLLERKIG